MLRTISALALLATAMASAGRSQREAYSGLLEENGHTWCVYKDSAEFKFAAATVKPTKARGSTLDGKKADLSNVDLPEVPVMTELSTLPFVQAVAELRRRAIEKFCRG